VKEPDQATIEGFAKRDDRTVTRITMAFALGGALADIGAHVISGIFMNGVGISILWGLWIPLCFITIPPIHYLCRHVQNLHKRIDALESQLGDRQAA
jgi:hypothetical protein